MKEKSKKKKVLLVTLEVVLGGAVGFFAPMLYDHIKNEIVLKEESEKFGNLGNIMLKSWNGRILTLESFENPISVEISNFSAKEKQQIVESVNKLDSISDTLNYVILDSPNANLSANIHITRGEVSNEHAAGTTHYRYNNNYKITYPITITINQDSFVNEDESEFFEGTAVEKYMQKKLSRVVKHELMHTLGFADLYDEQYKGDTLMWYTTEDSERLYDFTSQDEYNIKQLYDNILVETHYPKQMQITFLDSPTKNDIIEESELCQ